MDKKTAVVALMAVFSLAICFIILGSISVELMEALKIDEAQLGSLVMALFLTSCIVQLIIGPLVDKLGYKPVAITGFLVTSASLFLLAYAPNYGLAMFACILLGIGAMSCNTVGNTLIPVVLFQGKDPARASNFGNAFFGLGYVLTPWLLTLFLKVLGLSYVASVSIIATDAGDRIGFTYDRPQSGAPVPSLLDNSQVSASSDRIPVLQRHPAPGQQRRNRGGAGPLLLCLSRDLDGNLDPEADDANVRG